MLKAFHGDPAIKQKYLDRVRAHRAAGNLIQGTGWDGSKGCAVGCTLEKYDHAAYETELGIPEWLARVKDSLHRGMTENDAMAWPERFLSAIPVGADLEQVKAPFLIYVLECALEKFDHDAYPDCKEAIVNVIELYRRGETDVEKFRQAVESAEAAATFFRRPRVISEASWVAEAAAESARWAADAGAVLAVSLAYQGALMPAISAELAARSAAWSEEEAEYKRFADKLIELMSAVGNGAK